MTDTKVRPAVPITARAAVSFHRLVVGLAAGGLLWSGYLAVGEWQTRRIEALATDSQYRDILSRVSCQLGCSPRVRLVLAGATDRLAAAAPPAVRLGLIRDSFTDLDLLAASAATRPAALMERVYALSLLPERDSAVRTALKQSYAADPFDRENAPWRTTIAAAHWRQLDDATKAAALREAQLASGIDRPSARAIGAAMQDSPMAVSFLLRQKVRR